MKHINRAAWLALIAVGGQCIIYALSIVLARNMDVDAFEAYVVASAAFTMMVMFAPRGMEKYALRILPVLYERQDWGRARGFFFLGVRRTIFSSLLTGVAGFIYFHFFADYPAGTRLAIGISILSLPTGALAHFGTEVLSANGRDMLAMSIFRCLVPALVFAFIGSLALLPIHVNGAMAVGCWGAAWTIAMIIMGIQIRRYAPSQVWTSKPITEASEWKRESRPFQNYRIALAVLAQVSFILLDRLQPSASTVGAYAAAMGTVNLALVFATTTNRFYSRKLSMLLEQRNFDAILKLRKARLQIFIPVVTVFLILVFSFGREILGFFRPAFATEGLSSLYLLSISTAVSILFSLAPTYLKFMGHYKTLFKMVIGAAGLQILLLFLLVPKYAAFGGAVAYTVSMGGMFALSANIAHKELVKLRREEQAA